MKTLIKKEYPGISAEIIEIFEMELNEVACLLVPVSIDNVFYKFVKNKYGYWEPNTKAMPINIEVRWYICELIESLL